MKEKLLLMRDIVDCQLLDTDGERITKASGVEVERRSEGSPVLSTILVGPEPLARRIGPRTGRLVHRITGGRRTVRIPWAQVENAGPDIRLNVSASATGTTHAEDWVRERIIGRIPGAR